MQSLSPFFANKRILIITSGSIALYKILELISMLKKLKADIKVVMSEQSCHFIAPLSFEALSGNAVLSADSESWAQGIHHIEYAKWAQVVLIAPASANTIAKIACGIADSVHLSTILATNAPKLLAPAMNTTMLNAPQTQRNLRILQDLGYVIIPPRVSTLACGEYGNGALAEINDMIFALGRALCAIDLADLSRFYNDRFVIISGGGSKESIDSVRYISNHSSGKQSSELARVLYMLGANVIFISSAFPIPLPSEIQCVTVSSADEYMQAIKNAIKAAKHKPIVFMAAAISDYKPHTIHNGKLKKDKLGALWQIECEQNVDILATLNADSVMKIGFKAETDATNAPRYAKAMLESKHCQMVCLNVINAQNPFGSDNNEMMIFTPQSKIPQKFAGSKSQIALNIACAFAESNDTKH